jgi:hypothetical protein
VRLAPITGPGVIEETTIVSHQEASSDQRRSTDQELRRLARVDLLNLAAGWKDPEDEHGDTLENLQASPAGSAQATHPPLAAVDAGRPTRRRQRKPKRAAQPATRPAVTRGDPGDAPASS